jgi:prophage regulatory protein
MSPKILRLPEVKARTGLSRSSIYASIQQGNFPPSIHLGARAVGWLDSDITDWIESRISASAHNTKQQPNKLVKNHFLSQAQQNLQQGGSHE